MNCAADRLARSLGREPYPSCFEGPRAVMASAPRRLPARSRVPADRKSGLVDGRRRADDAETTCATGVASWRAAAVRLRKRKSPRPAIRCGLHDLRWC